MSSLSSTFPARERTEFAPPPAPGQLRALGLALFAHALLLMVLAAGVQWRSEAPVVTVEAELWASIPEQAAAPAEPPPPLPPEPVKVQQPPKPETPPVAKPAEPLPDPKIAIAREKARKQKEKDNEEEQKRLRLADAKLQKEKDRQAAEKAARDKKPLPNQSKLDAKKLEELRQQNLKRMTGLAGAGSPATTGTGEAGSTGSAANSAGPSASYAGRIRARIKPNIVYLEPVLGNPAADVEVRTAPDGTILSRKLIQPSGLKSWDDAVLNAIDKTEVLPRDVDGRVPSTMVISFRPKD